MLDAGVGDSRPPTDAPGQVTEYDLSNAARQLGLLRLAEFFLIYLGLLFASLFIVSLFFYGALAPDRLIVYGAMVAFGVVAFLSSGKLKPSVWRSYRFILPLSVVVQILITVDLFSIIAGARGNDAAPFLPIALRFVVGAIVSVFGAIAVYRVLKARIDPTPRRVADTIDIVERERLRQASPRRLAQPISRGRGFAFIIGAFAIIYVPKGYLDYIPLVWDLLVVFALFRARQYFQLSAESLLNEDKRRPILFLRSFADDPKLKSYFSGQVSSDEMAGPTSVRKRAMVNQIVAGPLGRAFFGLIDYSIEMRFSNHFMDFGPFIAVGSPQDTVPQIGAARVRLSDDEWQSKVAGWMETASVIVLMAGTTKWIQWELSKIVEGNNAANLILIWPRPLPVAGKKKLEEIEEAMKLDMAARFDNVSKSFASSRWAPALAKVGSPETLVAMRFQASGGITICRSERRNNDAYQLAVEILHLDGLDVGARKGEAVPAQSAA
jgi:hypothetical protein